MVCALLMTQALHAGPPQWAFRISFADKTGSPALSNPSAFLSTRALQRRSQQGIIVTDADRPVSPAYTDSVLRISGGKMHNTSRWMNQCVILVTDSSGIPQIRTRSFVTGVTLVGYFSNGLHKGTPPANNNTPTTGANTPAQKGTGSAAYYGATWGQTTMVNGDYLHDNGLTGQGQLIAMLDYGFDGANLHPGYDSLRQQGRLIDQYNFVTDETNIYSTGWDHGTTTLSQMAGLMPGSFVGSAPHAQYALYLTDDNNYTDALYELDNFIAGMERADSIGADIVSSSLGYNEFIQPYAFTFPKSQLDGHTINVARATNMAVARGIFVVITAGNEGGNSWNFLLTPGDADSALTVGAVNTARAAAGFTSPGPNSSGRIKPDVCALGNPAAVLSGSSGSTTANGTSYSTPQIAGWAACIRQLRPTITPYELRTAIVRSADRYTAPLPQYGYGIPDFRKVLQFVGVDQIPSAGLQLTVMPNPFREKITLQLNAEKAATIRCTLYDISGRVIATQEFTTRIGRQEFSFVVPDRLPAGTYTLKTTSNGQSVTHKLTRL